MTDLVGAPPLFIVGASRSGTTLTMQAFSRHPELHVTRETHYFDDLRPRMAGRHQSPLTNEERRRCEDYFLAIERHGYSGDGQQSIWITRDELRQAADATGAGSDAYFVAFCTLSAAARDKPRWGEKTPRHVFRIDDIVARFPDAKILCLIRDPRAVVASYRDLARRKAADAGTAQQLRKRRSYDLLLMSLMWRSAADRAAAAVRRYGDGVVRIVRYEDLVHDPRAAFTGLATWLDLDFSEELLKVRVTASTYTKTDSLEGFTERSVQRWRERLSDGEVATIQSVCGRWMHALGYELQPTDQAWMHIAKSWAGLPLSAARAAMANRERTGPIVPYVWRRAKGVLPTPGRGRRTSATSRS